MKYAQKHKVAITTFCCFLVAFVTLYVAKICGVFLFDNAISWGIWEAIDSIEWLSIVYYSFWSIVCTYLFVFTLSDKPYSRVLWHYIVIIIVPTSCVIGRTYFVPFIQIEFIYDIVQFIITPLLCWLVLQKGYRHALFINLGIIALNINMYFSYLGMKFFSRTANQLTTMAFTQTTTSSHFLVNIEIYFGMMLLMICFNLIIQYIKEKKDGKTS